jgi:hypothetical protein
VERQALSAYVHAYERHVARLPLDERGARIVTPEARRFLARAHGLVAQEGVSVRVAVRRVHGVERSGSLKALAGAVERSAGLKDVVRDLEAARVSAERWRSSTLAVSVEALLEIRADLKGLTQELRAVRSGRARELAPVFVVGAVLGGLLMYAVLH